MKAYFANALFSEADQMYNEYVVSEIRRNLPLLEVYLPQENPALNDKKGYADSRTIFHGDNEYLDDADILIAVLDGAEIDSGVAAEVGRFLAHIENEAEMGASPRYVFGLYTDVRQQGRDNEKKIAALQADGTENQFFYRNLYVVGGIKAHGFIASGTGQLMRHLAGALDEHE